jgi:hypothetical protein
MSLRMLRASLSESSSKRGSISLWVRIYLAPTGRSDRTRELYRDTVRPLRERLGEVRFRELTAEDVQETLAALAGRLPTRSLQIARLCLERAIPRRQRAGGCCRCRGSD